MARTRVFVSSTYYDLKYIRSSLEQFVESLGFDAVLSEKGDIAYVPDAPLDESCYREVQNSDIYVLIVGGRYGSEASEHRTLLPRTFYTRYESITKQEYKAAVDKDLPVYILIDRSVYAEYQTFTRNRDRTDVQYAHVDSVNIFHFVDEILAQPRNNPIQPFERFADIEVWLRDQWSGLFRELLSRTSSQQQIAGLAAQVAELAAVNGTLQRYLEEVISKVSPTEAAKIIRAETEKLDDARTIAHLAKNPFIRFLSKSDIETVDVIARLLRDSSTASEFMENLTANPVIGTQKGERVRTLLTRVVPARDLNDARRILGLPEYDDIPSKESASVVGDALSEEMLPPSKPARNTTSGGTRKTASSKTAGKEKA